MEKAMIAKLQKAGVAADVILSLIMDDTETPAATKDPAPEPKAEEPKAPAETPVTEDKQEEPAPEAPKIDAVLAAIEKLTGAVQASNIINRDRDYQAPRSLQEDADAQLAKILTGGK